MSECYAPEPLIETGNDGAIHPGSGDGTSGSYESHEVSETYEPSETYEGHQSYEYVDLDGDGDEETTLVDSNGDGEIDTVLSDVDGDYHDDMALFENVPGDAPFVPDVVALALDADGLADVVLDDTDLDGLFDAITPGNDEPLAYANPYEIPAGVPGA
ncbi:hypothetical protein I4I73_17770 [Pseudonocardia sp. KRD-184]|uniref:Uncharacterized protein n=1 Tax=Pseudonocardia oceani TaxID=2792013 RepID=A0ABS6UHS0_9PSEU|nr:hypothetical protein [Pseudonocardia oceani]MBW0093194.1 hypothetical protein [Pseudonocardia oceani]MBW0097828.1 hypothetical protein [Pseudonocardia oceani]MBW0112569.1 hypothetical protein [Pseudonocardia oceani]MBW0124420.1 hypothetical protein [Pseudonocardia oceani]MBW0131797.1 hypothetical protein [Pseudonocardia oceani]